MGEKEKEIMTLLASLDSRGCIDGSNFLDELILSLDTSLADYAQANMLGLQGSLMRI